MSLGRVFGLPTVLVAVFGSIIHVTPTHASDRYALLHAFGGQDGGPESAGTLAFDAHGNLYGTMAYGGAYGPGVVFSLSRTADGRWSERILHAFAYETGDGMSPFGGVIFDAAGNLYGTTNYGGEYDYGTAFELSPGKNGRWTERILYSFTGGADGGNPFAGLIFDSAGNLYGTTENGGDVNQCSPPYGCGTVFQLKPDANGQWTERVLHTFDVGNDGRIPEGGLIFDQAGALYGTTAVGGTFEGGIVFRLMQQPDGEWTERVLHSFGFDRYEGGGNPYGNLIFDTSGNLYGTTSSGGNFVCPGSGGCGTVFQLQPNTTGGWTERVLHKFNGKDGMAPSGGLVFDPAGNLFGTATEGGNYNVCYTYGCGTVFELSPHPNGKWSETLLHSFDRNDGVEPRAGLALRDGKLYGITWAGGKLKYCGAGCGVVFEIAP